MHVIKNDKGASLINVLALMIFLVLTLSATVSVVVYHYRASLRVTSFEKSYTESYQTILSTYRALDSALASGSINLLDAYWIAYQETHLVTITVNENIYTVEKSFFNRTLVGTLEVESENSETLSVFDQLELTKDLISDPQFRTNAMLDLYIDYYFFGEDVPGTRTYAEAMTFLRNNATLVLTPTQFTTSYVSENTYVTGAKSIGTNQLVVAPGKYLVFQGNLTINRNQFSRLDGTIITSGFTRLTRVNNSALVSGLYFTNDYFYANNRHTFGNSNEPFILFARSYVDIRSNPNYNGYIVSEGNLTMNSNKTLHGGVYSFSAMPTTRMSPNRIALDEAFLSSTQGQFLVASLPSSENKRILYKPFLRR